ncbi:alpha/beta hydrolase [Komagataeibacter kakiaceti JCM 25156]|uniref:alpha/beta fold hydrolase n=1 Tax=Komagataeibacter kakiaceti TaxID=943261 RepID=UPI000A0088DC
MNMPRSHADIIPGFEWTTVDADGIRIRAAFGGRGPALLLLHGHPQTHLTWHKVAPALAERFTVVATDLRGYGDSDKPDGGVGHVNYSKRAMAMDQVNVMRQLGHDCFNVIAHDRGARVAHRMALDHANMVKKLVLIDIAPTLTMYERTNMEFARRYFWWFFLIQAYPLPEKLIEADPDFFLEKHIAGQIKIPDSVDHRVMQEYRRCYRNPATRHAICEDYRAAASIDLVHDREDFDNRIQAPLMALWGKRGTVGALYDVLETWREKATNVSGYPIDCGHSPQEEAPEALLEALGAFL